MIVRLAVLLIAMVSPVRDYPGWHSGRNEPVPRHYFGLHIHRAAAGTPWPSVEFGSWRLWDAGVAWPQLEPDRNRWDFRLLDRYVELAASHNVEILLTLGLTPEWASARPSESSAYKAGNAAEPKNIADWEVYVRTVSTRYRGKIHEYEIWNEPNARATYSGSPETMAELARTAYHVLKSVDPTVLVVSPSPTAAAGVSWLGKYLNSEGCTASDIIGYHFYVTPSQPEAMIQLIDDVKKILRQHHCAGKPIWNTESGWAAPKNFSSEVEAAGYLMRTLVINWLMGIDRVYWYAWDNHNWSTLATTNSDTNEASSAGLAYGVAERWLTGSVLDWCSEQRTGVWSCVLHGHGSTAYIVWSSSGSSTYSIPYDWVVRTIQDWRSRSSEATTKVNVSEAPASLTK